MMPVLLNQNDLTLLFQLLVAYLIADFVLQKYFSMHPRSKSTWLSARLYIHGAIAGVLAYSFAGFWKAWWVPVIVVVSHVLLDGCKSAAAGRGRFLFLTQVGHLLAILVCWGLLADVNIEAMVKVLARLWSSTGTWFLILSYLAVIWPAGLAVGKILKPWRQEFREARSEGLEKAGLWIGGLERFLILTFILLNQFGAIGFLIAAKSIFRFPEIRATNNRKEAEYILIGTMLSFAVAITLGAFVKWFMDFFLASGK